MRALFLFTIKHALFARKMRSEKDDLHNSHLGHEIEIIEGQSAQLADREIADRLVMSVKITGGAIPEIAVITIIEVRRILEADRGRWVEIEEIEEVLRMIESPEEAQKDQEEAFLTRENHEEVLLLWNTEEVQRDRREEVEVYLL